MKVYTVGGNTSYANFIEAELVDNLREANIVLFTGGEDVTPSLYGCKKHSSTYSNPVRDKEEIEVFKHVKLNQLCLGICRGSQFLCVMNGGKLVQNCTGHAITSTHSIVSLAENMTYEITSTHHQMQYPYELPSKDYEVLYISNNFLSEIYDGDGINTKPILNFGEPEIVLYHKEGLPMCLAVQGHPEMIPNSPVSKMINNKLKELVECLVTSK